jgi:hypothetical protein
VAAWVIMAEMAFLKRHRRDLKRMSLNHGIMRDYGKNGIFEEA